MGAICRSARGVLIATAVFAVFAAQARAVPIGTPLGGTITVTTSEGKDTVQVSFQSGSEPTMTVFPAATVTATTGSCSPNTDPLTGRPTVSECRLAVQQNGLIVNLRGGDDTAQVNARSGVINSARVNAGAGNDTFTLVSEGISATLAGDDGNDLMTAAGTIFTTSSSSNVPFAFIGGAGTDTAGWVAPQVFPSSSLPAIGVNASLATNTGIFAAQVSSSQPTTLRTDTLATVESLSGTDTGDVLTGNTAVNTLLGNGGNDNLNGGAGNDGLQGGDGLDDMVGGAGSDAVDGGLGIDTYPAGSGEDTFNTRDGFIEDVTCVKSDVIVDDLVDRVLGDVVSGACSVSTAAAKHRYDTTLSGRPARVVDGALRTKVRCPAEKPETCEGELEAVLGKRTLGRARYEVQPGKRLPISLPISKGNARRAEGKRVVLSASEVDADGRDRFVSRPTRVAKQRR